MSVAPRLRLHLTAPAENAVRRGHPWVFADRIADQNRPGAVGELAILYDRKDRFLALGLYDPGSPIRVRVLHSGTPVNVDGAWWVRHLQAAIDVRRPLFDERTTGWRWVHGENDGWPGLVLDRYGDVLVLKLYTAAWLPRLEELVPIIRSALQPRSIVLRLSRNIAELARGEFGRQDGQVIFGEPVEAPVIFLEDGLSFEAEVLRGQKTGFFLDQRENRRWVGAHADGFEVLNCFSFSGGFSLHAARGGARSVTDVDISPHALSSASRNFALNQHLPGVARSRHETVQADTFDWLAADTRRQFDLVILDPPSLARRESEREGALIAYARLAQLGATRVRRGGLLLAASCSAHVSTADFFQAVRQGIARSGRTAVELQATAHPADHPARFPEAHYLKSLYLQFPGS